MEALGRFVWVKIFGLFQILNSNAMKKNSFLFLCAALSTLFSCTLDVDFDGKDSRPRISTIVYGDNADGSVSQDGLLSVEIEVEDHDGIASVRIRIPELNIDFFTRNRADNEYWNIKQTFEANEINNDSSGTVYITLTDTEGNSYSRSVRFSIK